MKKNFKKVGMILSMVAMVSFTMTSCGETKVKKITNVVKMELNVEKNVETLKK